MSVTLNDNGELLVRLESCYPRDPSFPSHDIIEEQIREVLQLPGATQATVLSIFF